MTSATNLLTKPLTSKDLVLKAHSQLTSVIIGRSGARDTSHLADNPADRIAECLRLTMEEYIQANALTDDDERTKRCAQIQRKLASLESLKTIASLISEIDWED
jgi:hypothetical protein